MTRVQAVILLAILFAFGRLGLNVIDASDSLGIINTRSSSPMPKFAR
jgi:hypothetical protein